MWQWSLSQTQSVVNIVFYLFGIFGVAIAFVSLRANRHNQREANARRAYLEYARLAMEYPHFAFPRGLKIDFEKQEVENSNSKFEQYEWFISIVIATARFLLELVGRRSMWRQMMLLQLAYHWEYLDRFRNEKEYLKRWSLELNAELNDAIVLGRRLYPRKQT